MSGKRQHFIPQFLQRGFASHIVGDEVFTWVYRKGAHPFNTNIKNIGVERAFYTLENDTVADDLITGVEGPLSELVERLLISPGGPMRDPLVPSLIAHLEIRTRHFRQCYMQSAEYLMSQFIDFIADADSFAESFERTLRDDPSSIREMFSEELAAKGLPPSTTQIVMGLLPIYMPILKAKLRCEMPQLAAFLRQTLPRMVSEAAKSGQIKALKGGVSPAVRVHHYESLSYRLLDIPDKSLVLGDSAVVFRVDAPKPYKTFWEKNDRLQAVFLPLAPERLLVGTHSEFISGIRDLSQAIAGCSLEYFITHDNCEANDLLKDLIGRDAYLLSRSQMKEILSEVFR